MDADKTVKALRATLEIINDADGNIFLKILKGHLSNAADLIESLQEQLAESQRRESAAVEDMKYIHCAGRYGCEICLNNDVCKVQNSRIGRCHNFDWRGPQEGEQE